MIRIRRTHTAAFKSKVAFESLKEDLYVHKATEYENMAELKSELTDRFEKIIGRSPRGK